MKFVKIPNRRLDMNSITINISGKKYEPNLLETMALKTLTTMKSTLKLLDVRHKQWQKRA